MYLLPRAFSLFCTCPAYNKSGKALARSLFLFSCSLNLITFCAPHLEVLELMTLPKTAALIAKYHPLSNSFSSNLIWVTAAFFQAKQRALERALKKYIFAGAAWSENSEDLMIYALIWNSVISDECLLNAWTAYFDWRDFLRFEENSRHVISRIFKTVTLAKVYLAVILGIHFWMHLLSRSVFTRMIFFTLFTIYFLFLFSRYFW